MGAFGQLSGVLLFCFLVACLPALTEAQGAITQALFFGNVSSNTSFSDCVWRRGNNNDECPDPDINYYLYTSDSSVKRKQINVAEADWLRTSGWNPEHENVVIIHGYNSGDDSDPVQVLRNAYLKEGGYNVVVVDWSPLSKPPCYPAAVHNLQSVARCAADMFTFLRNSGLPVKRTTCVGHSLGAHVCGIMSKYLLFRMYRIIGLDPARPLVRGQNRLVRGDAEVVQVIHTNAGVYGETGRVGTVDFCLNGGKEQPFCANKTNVNLCSHVRSICYLAESINQGTARLAEQCRGRCPSAQRAAGNRLGVAVPLGQHTPDSASGMYCLSSSRAPYCPSAPGAPGDHRCCV